MIMLMKANKTWQLQLLLSSTGKDNYGGSGGSGGGGEIMCDREKRAVEQGKEWTEQKGLHG